MPDSAPPLGQMMPPLAFEWTGQPKKKHFPQYIRWMNTVMDDYAKRWGVRTMQLI
jgi:hypothetical protein